MIIKKKKDPELLRKLEQRSREQPKLIKPIVNKIFNECLAKDQTISFKNVTYDFDKKHIMDNGRISVQLMTEEFGFEKEDSPVLFDPEKIEEYRKGIKYMLGQLKVIHDGKNVIPVELTELREKYGDYGYWTDTITPVTELCYLGKAAGYTSFFEFHKDNKKIYTKLNMSVVPTFDPDDKEHAE